MHRIIKTHYHCAHSLVLVVFAILAGAPVVANAETLLWSDEFDSGTAPNPDVWTPDLGNWGWGNNELQNYTSDPANLRVENGNLVIAARKSGSGSGASFTSARIKSIDNLTVKYGTIEARIKVPDLGDGLWPAFWTLGNNFSQIGWPFCGELDVMEMGHVSGVNGGVVNRRTGSAAHWDSFGNYASYGEFYDAAIDLNDDFHVFRMEWTPDLVSTYIDGNRVWSMDISSTAEFSEFHAPHFILLNLAVGGSFTGIYNPDGITASFPAEYLIDYVRIYDNGHTVLGGSSWDGGDTTPPVASTLIDNGDTTLDTASGLEWLDLTLTQGVSAQDVLNGFGGYVDAGWSFATVEQVCGLLGALGEDTAGCTSGAVGVQMNSANAETLVNLLGNTVGAGRGAYGMFNNIGGFPNNFGLACFNDTATSCTGGGASSWLTLLGWGSGYQTVGSFLVRDVNQLPPVGDSDGDGVTDALDQCPGTPAGTAVDADGCPLPASLRIEAEDYTAYSDNDAGSNGAVGNPGDSVDIEATSDAGGGRNVGWTVAGEWLEYQVTLNAGVYVVDTRVASLVSAGAYDLLLDGVAFGSDTVTGTGGWQVWETHSIGSVTVTTSGLHTLRVNVTGNDFNLNWIELTQVAD